MVTTYLYLYHGIGPPETMTSRAARRLMASWMSLGGDPAQSGGAPGGTMLKVSVPAWPGWR